MILSSPSRLNTRAADSVLIVSDTRGGSAGGLKRDASIDTISRNGERKQPPVTSGKHIPAQPVRDRIASVIVPRDVIHRRVEELGRELCECYQGRELTILAVLNGALVFLADLIRTLPLAMRLDVVSVTSYPGAAVRTDGSRFRLPPSTALEGKHILVLDDILDSGGTLGLLLETLTALTPASLRSCVLLRKRRVDLPDRIDADFVGFDIEDEFVVGYGLDHDHLYRNLPDICTLDAEALARGPEGEPQ